MTEHPTFRDLVEHVKGWGDIVFANKKNVFLTILVSLLILRNIFSPVWFGPFGLDIALMASQVREFFNNGNLPHLDGAMGTHGQYNGLGNFIFFSALYSITKFNIGWSYLITSVIFVITSVLITLAVPFKKYRIWVLLFALTSPLYTWHSTASIWYFPSFLIIAIAFYLHCRNSGIYFFYEFLMGFLFGVALTIHISSLVYTAGLGMVRIVTSRSMKVFTGLAAGFIVGALPYLIGLWQIWPSLNMHLFPQDLLRWPILLQLRPLFIPFALFRFFGKHPIPRVNTDGFLLTLEDFLCFVTAWLIAFLSCCGLIYLWRNRKKIDYNNFTLAVIFCILIYIPFGWFTNSLWSDYKGWMVWWITPIIIPFIIFGVFKERTAKIILVLLLAFNIVTTTVEYYPRIIYGTSNVWGHGPSWWMQEKIVDETCAETLKKNPHKITVVEIPQYKAHTDYFFYPLFHVPRKFYDHNYEALIPTFKFRNPACASRILFVQSAKPGTGEVLRIEPDESGYHLRTRWVEK